MKKRSPFGFQWVIDPHNGTLITHALDHLLLYDFPFMIQLEKCTTRHFTYNILKNFHAFAAFYVIFMILTIYIYNYSGCRH